MQTRSVIFALVLCAGCSGPEPVGDDSSALSRRPHPYGWGGRGTGHGSGGTTSTPDMAEPSEPDDMGETSPGVDAGKGSSTFSIAVSGSNLVDANGKTVQLRGVNVSGLEGYAVQGWSPQDPWAGMAPNFTAIKSWGANAIRVPLNEASWNGGTCVDEGGFGSTVVNGQKKQNSPGQVINPDPGNNYHQTLITTVQEATAANVYVILDLHMTAPGNGCPETQNPSGDADNSVRFWSSLAAAFKGYPNVIFELFNEPYLDQVQLTGTPADVLIDGGGDLTSYNVFGNPSVIDYKWQAAGFQAMLNAIRATGATNVILSSTVAYSTTTGDWLDHHPIDTLKPSQVGAVWHVYPSSDGSSLVNCIGTPSVCSPATKASAQGIIKAGYPVVITEYGDAVGQSQLSSMILPFADANGMSYLGWTWDAWGAADFDLITDENGTPTAGYGEYVKSHYLCRAAGTTTCQ